MLLLLTPLLSRLLPHRDEGTTPFVDRQRAAESEAAPTHLSLSKALKSSIPLPALLTRPSTVSYPSLPQSVSLPSASRRPWCPGLQNALHTSYRSALVSGAGRNSPCEDPPTGPPEVERPRACDDMGSGGGCVRALDGGVLFVFGRERGRERRARRVE